MRSGRDGHEPGAPDPELTLLESIYRHGADQPVRQRELAKTVGISLGMTNVLLKKCVQKGWVTLRRANSRSIQYAVTLAGINEIAHRSYRFIKRTVHNIVRYKDMLEDVIAGAKARGCRGITLIGQSDFEFMLQHLCHTHGLEFRQAAAPGEDQGWLVIYAEDVAFADDHSGVDRDGGRMSLREILIGL
jgi:DNA-binding MarR family transcriptional regulator